jgi:hypothetical protein
LPEKPVHILVNMVILCTECGTIVDTGFPLVPNHEAFALLHKAQVKCREQTEVARKRLRGEDAPAVSQPGTVVSRHSDDALQT